MVRTVDRGKYREGEIVQSGGSGGGSDGYKPIAEVDASGKSSVELTSITSDYSGYVIELTNIEPVDDNSELQLRVSTDGGSTYESGASDYQYATHMNHAGESELLSGSTEASRILLHSGGTHVGNDVGEGLSATVKLSQPSESNMYQHFHFHGSNFNVNIHTYYGGGVYTTETAIDALELSFSSGNFSSGDIILYGMSGL